MENFKDCKVGDVLVSLQQVNSGWARKVGEMFQFNENSNSREFRYKEGYNSERPYEWRMATPKETSFFKNGIKNIEDIPKESNYEIY